MGFYIQDDYWEAVEDLPRKQQDEVMGALVRLFFDGDENPGLKGVSKAVFTALRERVKSARKKSITWNEKRVSNEDETGVLTEFETPVNPGMNPDMKPESTSNLLNKRERERKKDEPNGSSNNPPNPPFSVEEEDAAFGASALAIFNEVTGQSVQCLSPSTWSSLARIRRSGRTLDDVRTVVSYKADEWAGSRKMSHFIRPSTLFGENFEEYLNTANAASEAHGEVSDFAAYD